MSEEYYDETIAPMLHDIAALCRAEGMSFFAVVQYGPYDLGETRCFGHKCHPALKAFSGALADLSSSPSEASHE